MEDERVAARSPELRVSARRAQAVDDEFDDTTGSAGPGKVVGMSLLNETGGEYVDGSGVGHVKVNESMDWSDSLPNDTTVRIIYVGSGSSEEILLIPVNATASDSGSSADSASTSGNDAANPVYNLPGSNSSDSESGSVLSYSNTGSTPMTLAIVGGTVGVIAVIVVIVLVVYGKNGKKKQQYWQQRRESEPSIDDDPFIVSLPRRPTNAGPVSILDTDITPDRFGGPYRPSREASGHSTLSFSDTAILSDNYTTPSHRRLTVDVSPFTRYPHENRSHLDDIVEPGRSRTGTTPVVVYDRRPVEDTAAVSGRYLSSSRQSNRYPPRNSRQAFRQPDRPSQREYHRESSGESNPKRVSRILL